MIFALALAACSTEPQTGRRETAQIRAEQSIEECSFFGELACKAMALTRGERQATCVAIRSASGTRSEQCRTSDKPSQAPAVKPSNKTPAVSARLAWSDNSNNEQGFIIERCDQVGFKSDSVQKTPSCAGSWKLVANVGANVTTYVDNSVLPNRTYLYRVKAINNFGSSAYTEALFTTPSD